MKQSRKTEKPIEIKFDFPRLTRVTDFQLDESREKGIERGNVTANIMQLVGLQ